MHEMYFGASTEIKQRAKELREMLTPAEKVLWEALQNRKLNGLKFRRQHPISKFIADFYCHEYQLVVEVDGEVHLELEQVERDEGRTFELEELGLKVIRFTNKEVFCDLENVLKKIVSACGNK
ncbi:endonuclease domain-containing protein [Echinicola soli]|uniref:Endonuclease domain-containing protein n=1 Tax=Echinicola soli TaxID=2591634 RepID=A0A514CJ56_9BACT|nr:endonuclease domain-containing protein [Echinicola soli]QDH79810.1 endonuclease domain-containing protein [Echinicola soli]